MGKETGSRAAAIDLAAEERRYVFRGRIIALRRPDISGTEQVISFEPEIMRT